MYNFLLRLFLNFLFCTSIIFSSNNFIAAQNIEGYVFLDSNNNSIMDSDEKGINNVMVSNQKDVVITNENGHFQLKLIEGNYIFVTKPESFQFKLDMFNNPEFYYLYRTKKIKEEFRYSIAEPISEIPEVLYFPVYINPGEEEHSCLLIGDPQMKNKIQLNYYREGVIPFMSTKDADFYVILGDVANNYLGILPKEKFVSSSLGIPGYRVFGNHDMNFNATRNKYAAETFKLVYGPDNYSFDYGSFHYIILNSVVYEGWQQDVGIPGLYTGGLTQQQLKWLKNDLEHVSSNKTIVLFSHISLHEIFIMKSIMKIVFKALKNHNKILAVSGHMHRIIAYDYTAKHGWKSSLNFEGLVAGAVCGSWWTGPLDENDIPYAICSDGSPRGFFQLNTKEEDYNYVFHSLNDPFDLQFRIYTKEDEIRVNWFLGKRTDSVLAYIDDNPKAIKLHNFIAADALAESNSDNRKYIDVHIQEFKQIAHLWKAKLPEGLTPGQHSIMVIATDSKGKTYSESQFFMIDEK